MGPLSWIIVGTLAAMLVGMLVRGEGFGFLGDLVVGIIGACIGGGMAVWIFHIPDPMGGINLGTVMVASLGALVFISLIRMAVGWGRRT